MDDRRDQFPVECFFSCVAFDQRIIFRNNALTNDWHLILQFFLYESGMIAVLLMRIIIIARLPFFSRPCIEMILKRVSVRVEGESYRLFTFDSSVFPELSKIGMHNEKVMLVDQ